MGIFYSALNPDKRLYEPFPAISKNSSKKRSVVEEATHHFENPIVRFSGKHKRLVYTLYFISLLLLVLAINMLVTLSTSNASNKNYLPSYVLLGVAIVFVLFSIYIYFVRKIHFRMGRKITEKMPNRIKKEEKKVSKLFSIPARTKMKRKEKKVDTKNIYGSKVAETANIEKML